MPPPGDIRNVLTAMADVEPLMAQIMKYRFSSGEGLAGHSLGNLILAALTDISGTSLQQSGSLAGCSPFAAVCCLRPERR